MAETRIVIVVPEDAAGATMANIEAQLPESATIISTGNSPTLHDSIEGLVRASAALPERVDAWWASMQMAGPGPVAALAIVLVLFAAVFFAERVLAQLIAARRRSGRPIDPSYAERISAALGWGLTQAARILFFYVTCRVLLVVVAGTDAPMHTLGLVTLATVLRFRIVTAAMELLAGAKDRARRPTGLTDADARHVMRCVLWTMAGVAILSFLRDVVDHAVMAGRSGALFAVATYLLTAALGIAFLFAVRAPVTRIVRAAFVRDGASRPIRHRLAQNWHALYIAIFVFAALTSIAQRLGPEMRDAGGASGYSALIFIITPFVIAGLKIWRDQAIADAGTPRQGLLIGIFALAEGVAILVAALLVLTAWNIDPFARDLEGPGRLLQGLISATLTVVVGVAIWRAAGTFLDAWAPDDPGADLAMPEGEMGTGGRSRFETVFPILRATVLVAIWSVAAMLALASLGVEIMPLLAGAGIVGIAVGFGAQTLVKDIISGVFYLWEDAFRVGEFIVTGEGKGVVEKILLRSVRLRHPRGPIYTIPFGSLGTIQNHSRDWVKIKFTLDIPPEQDLERVRKLIKKVGVALEQDPELEGKFIQPLKSQGAVAMAGPNYQLGVKFICAPGEQFLIRRKAFAALQRAFQENGIELATPRVSVDSPDAIAAAAASATTARPAAE